MRYRFMALTAGLVGVSASGAMGVDLVNPVPLGRHSTGLFDASAAEIPAYDPATKRLFVVNATVGVDVLDLTDPTNPAKLFSINAPGTNSVSIHGGLVAVAVQDATVQAPGTVQFFQSNLGSGDSPLNTVTVGALPDMLTFTPDGTKVLVANEGEPNDNYDVDPEGSVSIIDLSGGVGSATVATASFASFNTQHDSLVAAGVRIYGPGATVAQDLEPEYITVSGDKAYVALQENNAVAVVDIPTATVTNIAPLGMKDHSQADSGFKGVSGSNSSNALDSSNRDSGVNIQNWPVLGMYQPDAIIAYEANGSTFLVSANEGDARDYNGFSEEVRGDDLALDPTAFPDATTLQANENLGRIRVTSATGDLDGDGDFDQLHTYGARSFSIWQVNGDDSISLVFDSGDDFEQITASLLPNDFNSNNDENGSLDSRSDDKGPEPEGLALGQIGDKTYAFVGLERVGGVMVYDITDPTDPSFLQYLNSRDFSVPDVVTDLAAAGDLGPEGLLFIDAAHSPTGVPLLVIANEVSGTTAVFAIPEPVTGGVLAIGLAGLVARRRK